MRGEQRPIVRKLGRELDPLDLGALSNNPPLEVLLLDITASRERRLSVEQLECSPPPEA
jgi:hypothetical protein